MICRIWVIACLKFMWQVGRYITKLLLLIMKWILLWFMKHFPQVLWGGGKINKIAVCMFGDISDLHIAEKQSAWNGFHMQKGNRDWTTTKQRNLVGTHTWMMIWTVMLSLCYTAHCKTAEILILYIWRSYSGTVKSACGVGIAQHCMVLTFSWCARCCVEQNWHAWVCLATRPIEQKYGPYMACSDNVPGIFT